MKIPNYLTVPSFCEKHPSFNQGGIRHQIFHEETNGLKKSGAIIRIGRKVLIDEEKYFHWVVKRNV